LRKRPPEAELASDSRTQWIGADSILFATAHRPWPAPMTPWIMTQRWNDLLFMHYSLAPEVLRPLVPDILTLDTYQQRAWVSVTPFWINHLRPPGVPSVPWLSHFAEVNVRTYVTYGGKPGVYFFSLDASNLSAVWGARMFYRLPYWQASMKVKGRGGAKIDYSSKRQHGPKPAELKCSYAPVSLTIFQARPGTLQHFLTERYCLYAVTKKRLYRGEIHHLPWELQRATVELCENTMAKPAGLKLGSEPELVYFSRELKVLFWAPERLR
jgi:uncharacterized protein YqjF (DUF2071 family)